MSLVDLANTKVRVIGCSAVMGVAPMIASAIANPGVTAALGVMANPVVGGIAILATIAGSVAEAMAADVLGNRFTEKLAKNPNILDNHDLSRAAGEAIGYILKDVAKSDEFTALALSKNSSVRDLDRLADKTPEYWLNINTQGADLSRGLNISEEQLTLIFSADAAEFDRVTGLTPEDWARFIGEFAASEGKSFDADNRGFCGAKTVRNISAGVPGSAETRCGRGWRKVCGDAVEFAPNCFGGSQGVGAEKWGDSGQIGGGGNSRTDLSSDGEIGCDRS